MQIIKDHTFKFAVKIKLVNVYFVELKETIYIFETGILISIG
jgi:hypothetical protein